MLAYAVAFAVAALVATLLFGIKLYQLMVKLEELEVELEAIRTEFDPDLTAVPVEAWRNKTL